MKIWKSFSVKVYYVKTGKSEKRRIDGYSFDIAVERYFGKIGVESGEIKITQL